ncbi:kinase-like domain-containing protein [Pholiota molesta]|nr:kinase-like domain-containing protein [Pholiota molesta]
MLGGNLEADQKHAPYRILGVVSISLSKGARGRRTLEHLPTLCDVYVPRKLKPVLNLAAPQKTSFIKNFSILPKITPFATCLLIVCLTSRKSSEISGGETIAVLLIYALDERGNISIIGSTHAHVLATSSFGENSARRLDLSGRSSLPEFGHIPSRLQYHSHERIRSIFGFLKYAGPKRLSSSRKVLLDEYGYQITHIGQGAFAVISRVLYRPTGDVRVMKRITFDDSGLAKYLAKNESTLSGLCRDAAQFYSAQLLLAIQCLHKVGIIHRDIKPDNIFLDEEGHLVLADFGLAENIATYEGGEAAMAQFPSWLEARSQGGDNFPFLWFDEHNPLSMRGAAGTFWYTAPEVFRKERYSFGIDYWSVGVIYHELITGHIPFNHFKPYPENKCPVLDFRTKPGQLKDITSWEEEALSKLLAPYPAGRPKTLTDIKNNRVFQGVDWIRMSQKGIPPPSPPPPLVED